MTRIQCMVLTLGALALACDDDNTGSTGGSESAAGETSSETSTGEAGGEGEGEDDGDGDGDGDGAPMPDPNEMIPPPDAEGCHAIYAQELLPEFQLTIHPVVWEQLMYEWNNGVAIEEEGQDPKQFHPLQEFRYGDIAIYDAEIRLRGNATYWDPLPNDKMQFQINFQRNDPEGRFLGLERLVFDAATANRHLLRDRLSLSILRDAGVVAPCANNARLVINDAYYGIFTNIEKLDATFLQRTFTDPSGDLWKRANWQLETNELTASEDRLDLLKDAMTAAELGVMLDLEQALRELAVEAVIPDSDGAWAGGLNFYLYDDPARGKFVLLPWDLDNTFERFNDPLEGEYPANPDPYVWEKGNTHGRPIYDISLQDPAWFAYYIDQIDDIAHQHYNPAILHPLIDEWEAQIESSVLADINKPFSNETYYDDVQDLHAFIDARHAFLDVWVMCWQAGGVDDGTGHCTMP